jgi:nucleoside triphosphatase YtkD
MVKEGIWKGRKQIFKSNATCPQRAPYVFALVLHDKQVLLTDVPPHGWRVPGGHVEPGESLVKAVKREVFEETGALVRDIQFLGSLIVEPDSVAPTHAPVFVAELSALLPLPSFSEARDRCFASIEEIPTLLNGFWTAICEYAVNVNGKEVKAA